jgi:hypothetical protein
VRSPCKRGDDGEWVDVYTLPAALWSLVSDAVLDAYHE